MGIDAIRKRPGMYIGDTSDGFGLHNMVREVVSNAIQEAVAGFADRIDLVLNSDGSCTVRDNGRGIPTEHHNGIAVAELLMTQIHAAGKFVDHALPIGTQGVGVCVVNALSEWLTLRVWRNKREYVVRFLKGERQAPLAALGPTQRRGTEVTFLPDASIFDSIAFDFAVLEHWLRKLPLSATRVVIALTSDRAMEKKEVILNYGC